MKKKKLKTSFSSLLEDEEIILEGQNTFDEILPVADVPIPPLKLDKEFIERMERYQTGDLVEGIELLEHLGQVIEGESGEKEKSSILMQIKDLLTRIVKEGKTDEYIAVKSLLIKLAVTKTKVIPPVKKVLPSVKKDVQLEKIKSNKVSPEKIPASVTVTVEDVDIMSSFIQESKEHLLDIEDKILKFENEGDTEILNTIFRSVHTVKGTSSFLDLNSVKTLSHRLEFLLDDLRRGELKINTSVVDLLLEGTDLLGVMIDEIEEEFSASKSGGFTIPSHSKDIAGIEKKFESIRQKTGEDTENKNHAESSTASENAKKLISAEISASFAAESSDLLDEAEQLLMQLEGGKGEKSFIDTIFRNIHTIKGNAGFLGFAAVEKLAMNMESTLDTIRKNNGKELNSGVISILLQIIDVIKKSINEPNSSLEESEVQIKALGQILLENGTIEQNDLDKTLDIQDMKVGEILVTEGMINKEDLSEALEKQAAQKPARAAKAIAVVERKDIRVDMIKVDKLFDLMGELITANMTILLMGVYRILNT